MNNQPKQLGRNYSVFEDFVKDNRIYVDKTQHIYNLITAPHARHFYFVSRPRRFGKSLFLSTLYEIFSGKKELFNEYWIGKNSNYDWQKHPIIQLDFSKIAHGNAQELKQSLCLALQKIAKNNAVKKLKISAPEDMLQDLVQALEANGKIVLLIDEYDKPIIDHITNISVAEENRAILNGFYATIKALESSWRAIFITGVSKFAKTSLFSGLNNLTELSFDPTVAELFGYTYEELLTYFPTQINDLAQQISKTREETLADMKSWYDGYRFSKDMQKAQMYSPLSVVACLEKKEFSNYWFNTGTPGFLIALLREKGIALETQEPIQLSMHSLDSIDIHNIPLYTLLLQTGYLTITDYDAETKGFTLDYPNQEVRDSFKYYIMQAFAYTTSEVVDMQLFNIRKALANKDFEKFCNVIQTFFAGIPYDKQIEREAYYHSLLHLLFDLSGMSPRSEDHSSKGRADLVLETANSIIIFEFKLNSSTQKALDQILEKKYYEKYLLKNKAIILIGMNFKFKEKKLEFDWLQKEAR